MLLAVVQDGTAAPRDRIAAAKVLLEYGFAKAPPDALDGSAPLLTLEAVRAVLEATSEDDDHAA
jgi:hypothetical protein